jgi:TRAP transporter TAXI family solute receptor
MRREPGLSLMLRRAIIPVIVACLAAACGCDQGKETRSPGNSMQSQFCSSAPIADTGTFYTYAQGLINAAGRTLDMDLENRETSGSLENARLIADGDCAMGLVHEDTFGYLLDQSRNGADPDDTTTASKLRVIMAAYDDQVHFLINTAAVVDADADGAITPGDLAGKNVWVGAQGSDSYITAITVLESYGLDGSNCTLDTAPATAELAIEGVRTGAIDALFLVSSVPCAPLASEDLADAPLRLVRCGLKNGGSSDMYSATGILPASVYPFQPETVDRNLRVKTLVVVSDQFETPYLQAFYDYLAANRDRFKVNYDLDWSSFSLNFSERYLSRNPLIWDFKASEILSGYEYGNLRRNLYAGPEGMNEGMIAADIGPLVEPNFGYGLTAVSSSGSGQNAISILWGDATMAIVQDDVFDYLAARDDSYEAMKAVKMRKLMPLYTEDALILVNRAAGIDGIADLTGKNVCLGVKTSGAFITGIRILKSYGFDMTNAPNYDFAGPAAAVQGVVDGTYDAAVLVDSRPSPVLSVLSPVQAALVKLIPAKLKAGGFANSAYYEYVTATIPRAAYPELIDAVEGMADNVRVQALLVLSGAADDTPAYNFIDSIYTGNASGTFTSATGWDEVTPEAGQAYFRRNPYGWSANAGMYYCDRLLEE